MSRVIFDISMSLDGFASASNVGPEELLGEGGCRGQTRPVMGGVEIGQQYRRAGLIDEISIRSKRRGKRNDKENH
jgi:hypothetical protein